MELKCIECQAVIPYSAHYSTRKYCSTKCQGRWRRKQPGYKQQIIRLQKAWENKNKKHLLAYHRIWEKKNYPKRRLKNSRWKAKNPHYHRDYHYRPKTMLREKAYRQTPRAKEMDKKRKQIFNHKHPEYWREVFNKNPEQCRANHKKYRYSPKGIATFYRIYDKKRRRNMLYLNRKMDLPTAELIKMLKERDKVCFYCKREFDMSSPKSRGYPSFDHINSELPLIETNAVICCKYCNSSKKKEDVLSWLKKKGMMPSTDLLKLLDIQSKCI